MRNVLLGGYIAPALVLNKWEERAPKKESREGSVESRAVSLENEVEEWKGEELRRQRKTTVKVLKFSFSEMERIVS